MSDQPRKTIFVLGGYGGTGRVVCRRLLQHTDVNVVIGGRKLDKAGAVASDLRREFAATRVRVARADASDYRGLATALGGCSMVIVASATPQHAETVARAAMASGCDYLDYHFNNELPEKLESLRADIEKSGRCFITQAGFHPGLPAVFVRAAAARFSRYDEAHVGMVMNAPIENPDSIYELVDELQRPSGEVYREGAWRRSSWRDSRVFGFGRFGRKTCFPIKMLEMRPLPALYGLRQTGVYIAGFNWCTDYIVFPTVFLLGLIRAGLLRRPLAHLLAWSINAFPGKEPGVMFVLEASGEKDGKPKRVRLAADHRDAYDFTAIPVAACVRQYLDGTIKQPGVWLMGQVADPVEMLRDMKDMGVSIQEE